MILRLVVGVVLTAALLAVASPMLAIGAADAADSSVERQFQALEERLETMVETNDPTAGPGARHVTELTLPERSLTSAGVSRLRFHSRAGVGLATWRVGDGHTSSTRLAPVPIRSDGGAFVLREPGPHRLVFELRNQEGETVLTVHRLGDGGTRDA